MNPNNPYAAPQTLQPLATRAVALPIAEERPDPTGRVLFPEISTAALARIEAASRAIRRMTIVWTIVLAMLVIGVVMNSISLDDPVSLLVMLAACFPIAFRIYAGVERDKSMRYISLLIDLLPLLVVLYLFLREFLKIVALPVSEPEELLLLLLAMLLLNYLPYKSVTAHVKYFRLFGDERFLQDDLSAELTHRRKNRIP